MVIEKRNDGKPTVTGNVTPVVTQFVLLHSEKRSYDKKVLSDKLYYLYAIICHPFKKIGLQ